MLRDCVAFGAVAAALVACATPRPPGASSPIPRSPSPPPTESRATSHDFWSQALGTRKRFLVWLPPSYEAERGRRYPVAIYLHGAFGDETNWTRLGALAGTLDSLAAAGMPELIVVMPDGDDGWYTTWNWLGDYAACRRNRPGDAEPAATYCVPWPHYDDYIARDLVAHVDRTFRTIADRRHRGIAGLSMGGYGAVTLALSYPDVFGAAASHSGALAPAFQRRAASTVRPSFDLDSLEAAYPEALWAQLRVVFGRDSVGWFARDPLRKAQQLAQTRPLQMPALYVDCGSEDPLLAQNRIFRDGLRALGIDLAYVEYPGAHEWEYWRRHAAQSARWLAQQLSVR
ncbi:MAG TPA: alpha/beta hydrolase family protein [Gemmatimonadaceae bacterium]|nr:alpha/beta hydrolase family protein [Gemmatimonadaceae bacterium]